MSDGMGEDLAAWVQYRTFADALGVARTAANRLVEQFAGAIEAAAKQLYEEFETLALPADTRAGQLRVLRAIRGIVIREMAAKLSQGSLH